MYVRSSGRRSYPDSPSSSILLCKTLAAVGGLVDGVLVLLTTILVNIVLPLILNLSLGVILKDVLIVLGLSVL